MVLGGRPFHWKLGEDRILLVDVIAGAGGKVPTQAHIVGR
jgi:hypothetical protein